MPLRSRAWLALFALVLAVPAVVATGIGPAAAAGVPHIDSVSPDNAYVGYSFPITISGSNLTGTTSVDFNSVNPRVAESFVVVDDSTITAMTPALGAFSSGTTLTVASPGGTSNALPFTWTFDNPPAPVITGITPATGGTDGGDRIRHLNGPIVGISARASGYLLVAADGGVFAFGNASMFGSMSGKTKGRAIVGIVAAGNGYLLATRDGVRFSFAVSARGVASSTPVDAPIVGIA